ncbi:MAG: diol dehydratase small subunit [Candidatus Nanopelagicales bacterium]|jgi:propanediol dehydratase small subunit
MTNAKSGKPVGEVTLDALRAGDLGADDVRIHPETLVEQARVATANGNPQLAENFLRAAELAGLPDNRVMAIYESLRPRRSTAAQLEGIATELEELGAVRNAALIREAAQVYQDRNLLL